jgi:ferredoxin/flavodoxin---NADP+ reductase
MKQINSDILIVGAGPSGIYAAYYAGFRGLNTVVIDSLEEIGGQITAMYPEKLIFDVAGFVGIKGKDLINNLKAQADPYNPTYILNESANELSKNSDGTFTVKSENHEINVKAIIITGGIGKFTPRPLPAAADWHGKGLVHFVPSFELHKDENVVIVGGGDSAFDWALALHPIAKSISLVHRRDAFRAHEASVEQVKKLGINFYLESEVSEVKGSNKIEKVVIKNLKSQAESELPADTVVAALGFTANIGPLAEWGLELDKRRIVVNTSMMTNVDKIFAAGDISTYPGKVALISVGFGEAATAVNNAAVAINPEAHLFPGHSSGSVE